MLSNSSKYALKAVLFIAIHADEENKLRVKDFYHRINVPRAYLSKLLQELSRQKVISSSRGPRGGFYLNEANRQQTLIRIIDHIDGPTRLHSCMLSLDDCDETKPCPLHAIMQPARTKIIHSLEQITVDDLSKDLKAYRSFLPL